MKIGAWKFFSGILGILIFTPSVLMAAELRQVHVSWDYGTPVDCLKGFQLYKDGVKEEECITKEPSSKEMDCNVWLEVGKPSFTLTAYPKPDTSCKESEPSSSVVVTVEAKIVLPGDVNDSGAVDLEDLYLAQAILAGRIPSQAIHADADVNGDGQIGMAEVQYIYQKIYGVRK